ncbi:MAG: amidohydrolase family protein [Myxococcaceae bacterium]|nr:amidohydrolase family protein [Myxococcaceae bacterium]
MVLVPVVVHTGNPGSPSAEAIAFRQGKVLLVGALPQVLREAGPGAIVERLPQAVIVPGLADPRADLVGLGASLARAEGAPASVPLTPEQQRYRLKLALERTAALGLTSVHQVGIDLETFSLLQQWDAVGVLPIRVAALADGAGASWSEYVGRGRFEGRRLKLGAVSLPVDGPSALAPALLEQRARAFAEAGFVLELEASGAAAVSTSLDLLQRLEREHTGLRSRIAPAATVGAADVSRCSGRSVTVLAEAPSSGGLWARLTTAGAHLALSGLTAPLETLASARGQAPPSLSGTQVLEAMTSQAAWAERAEDRRGQLAPGYDADMTVLSADPLTATPAELRAARVLMTMVAGVDVYRAPELR